MNNQTLPKFAVFASGNGTNYEKLMQATIDNTIDNAQLVLLVVDKPGAFVIERAKKYGTPTLVVSPKDFENKQAYEQRIVEELKRYDVSFIALAGYMRVVGDTILNMYPNRILNVHPALLPKFKGAHAIDDAFNAGERQYGATVHLIDNTIDGGIILLQESFELADNEVPNRDTIEARIHQCEYTIFPKAVAYLSKHIMQEQNRKKRALFSVSDKQGVVEFATQLNNLGWEIIATGGTEKMLLDAGLNVINISKVTGFPEICDGRVKTLHPKVHGALLARRDDPSHVRQVEENGIEFIDLVCVNLYPFKATIAKPDVTMEDAIEHIDIGGPSMLRSAAKNWNDVTVVCNPQNYKRIIDEVTTHGNTTKETRLQLSAEAYTHTAQYDMCIATYMRQQAGLSEKLFMEYDIVQPLRYGENPHQSAKFYRGLEPVPYSLAYATQLQGKELSYNNIQDANAALELTREFIEPFCVGLKHMNPCGAAVGATIEEAWQKAYEADKVSIYGGIVAVNRPVTKALAEALKPIFLEIVLAPEFSEEALEILSTKKNLRLMVVDMKPTNKKQYKYVSVTGGLLAQDADIEMATLTPEMCVTEKKPSAEAMKDMAFGLRIVKHVKSNAIVVVKNGMTLGVGAGQMNRVGAAQIALNQAKENGHTEGLILASDAFFPFDDTVALAHQYGVTDIVQPGGSIHDEDSIKKANECNICMLMSGKRHFKH